MVRCKGCRKYVEQFKIHKYNVCSTECLGIVKRNSKPTIGGYRSMTVKQHGKHVPIMVQNKGQSHAIHQNQKKDEVKINKPTGFTSYYELRKGKYVEIFK